MRCSFFATLAILAGALLSAAAVRTELLVETTIISKPSQLPGETIQGWKCSHCGLESWNRNACLADEEGSERSFQMKQSVSSLDNKPVAKIKADNSVSDFFDGTATPHALVEHVLFTRMISDIVAAGPG